ncbi:structural protein [Pseudoalteromonas phage PH1]|uniref:structural protein n=1 Tax=Pseudoalteromonas phage PH1 TaxID=1874540 RepID=UPI000819A51A|nr:structural protein [Pseudoalteromonas phage PH1]ANY29556.1 hypothetical protein [Pseudoalteromonas phage PH1]
MSRIDDILARARDTLADPNGERWSTPRLVRLVSEAQQDIAKQTQMLKAQVDLQLQANERMYSLPDDCWVITRAAYNHGVIELVTHEQMDALARRARTRNRRESEYQLDNNYDSYSEYCWELETGDRIDAIIYDKRNLNEINLYPIPNETMVTNYGNGVTDTVDGEQTDSGVLTQLNSFPFNSDFGVLTSIAHGFVRIWYIKVPGEVFTTESDLVVPSMWDTAIKHYVVGHAFDDDYDSRFAEKSAKALALYDRELGVSKEFERKNNTRSGHRTVMYRSPFDTN